MKAAIVGVIGTLLGTVLGWLLNSLSRRGKLRIYPKWTDLFLHNDDIGGMVQSTNWNEAIVYSYYLSFDLYNSSGEPMIMRKIEVAFFNKKCELFRDVPQDDSTGRSDGVLRFYDDVSPITVPSKTVYTLKLHGGFRNSDIRFKKLYDIRKISLTYRNEHNKEKKIPIIREDFSHYFENHPIGEKAE